MGTTTQGEVIRLVTKLIYDSVRDAGSGGLPASYLFMSLEQHGCTGMQFQSYMETMKRFGLIADHPQLPDLLICPPGHEAAANRLAL